MRQVVSLSLPTTEVKQIKYIAHKRGYTSVSSYVKYLLQADKDLISETKILQAAKSARKEYQMGRSIKAKSISDLL